MKRASYLKHLKDLTQKVQKPAKRAAALVGLTIGAAVLGTGITYLMWNTFRQQAQLERFNRQVQQVADVEKRLTLEKDRLTLENAVNATRAQVIGGILVFLTAFTAWRNLKVAEEKQVTDRFSKAVEQLGHNDAYVRLGAIYSLERIANDSDKDYWQVIEILTAYVRGQSAWTQEKENNKEFAEANPTWDEPDSSLKVDIQAVLTVLGRRRHSYRNREEHPLDLQATDLRGADLRGAKMQGVLLSYTHLEGANLDDAHLEGAKLRYAYLERANLYSAHPEEANLSEANLECAFLRDAHLERADLSKAHLERADLIQAHLQEAKLIGANLKAVSLEGANLKSANLRDANLEGVELINNVDLEGANLMLANLKGADLKGAKNLTQPQLYQAKTDDNTQYPGYLQPPQQV
jgi:uncharacterized protein YjbI with pentapeptide repeats